MGYGVDVHTGVIKKCGPIKWFETKGGYSFYKFGDWDLEQSTIIDIDDGKHDFNRKNHEEYIYWINRDNNLVFRDDYEQSRKTISISKVIKDLKRLLNDEDFRGNNNLMECLRNLESDKKKGIKLVLFEGT
jgi:hypothetical protein